MLSSHLLSENIQNYNFITYFVWLQHMVSYNNGRTQDGVGADQRGEKKLEAEEIALQSFIICTHHQMLIRAIKSRRKRWIGDVVHVR
jgi:hypothetical protein